MNSEQKRNMRIGIFTVAAIGILFLGVNYLKGHDVFTSGTHLTAYFASVDGLTDASPVLYRGFKVGTVRDIDLSQSSSDPNKVFKVVINIEKDLDVPVDSRVDIISTDMLGGKGIDLIPGRSTELTRRGDSVASGVRLGLLDELMPVKDQASSLMMSADGVMRGLDSLLDARNRQKVDEALFYLAASMKNLESMTRNIDALTKASGAMTAAFANARAVMENLNSQSGRIDSILGSVNVITSDIASANLREAVCRLDSILGGVNTLLTANGNVAKVFSDAKLYDNLEAVSSNLNRLLVDLRLNPSRYITVNAVKFGGSQVYFSDTNSAAELLRGDIFAVCLTSGAAPSDVPSAVLDKKVIERFDGKQYKYLVLFPTKKEAYEFAYNNNILRQYNKAHVEEYVDGILKSENVKE